MTTNQMIMNMTDKEYFNMLDILELNDLIYEDNYSNEPMVWYRHPITNNKVTKVKYRYIMEKKLRRRLNSGEVVHHINFDHNDNRIENLEVRDNIEHRLYHGRIHNWVNYILKDLALSEE